MQRSFVTRRGELYWISAKGGTKKQQSYFVGGFWREGTGICTVTSDLWKADLALDKELLPHAELIHDRFHWIQNLTKSQDQVCRRETKHPLEIFKTLEISSEVVLVQIRCQGTTSSMDQEC